MRVSISIKEDIFKKLQESADKLGISRSAYISLAIQQKIKLDEKLDR